LEDKIYIVGVGRIQSGWYDKSYVATRLQEEFKNLSITYPAVAQVLKYKYDSAINQLIKGKDNAL